MRIIEATMTAGWLSPGETFGLVECFLPTMFYQHQNVSDFKLMKQKILGNHMGVNRK